MTSSSIFFWMIGRWNACSEAAIFFSRNSQLTRPAGFLRAGLPAGRLAAGPEGEHLESDERLEVRSGEQSLIEPHAELIQPE